MRHCVTLSAVLAVAACVALGPDGARAAAPPEQPAGEIPRRETDARPNQTPAPPTAAAKRKRRMNDRCNTPAMNCILFDAQPAGSSCWCVTPFGPSYGRVP
jgi:hypothetical protein